MVDFNAYDSSSRHLLSADLEDYMKRYSDYYKNVISIKELARGGEAIVYRLDHSGIDEVVIKTTKLDKANTTESL